MMHGPTNIGTPKGNKQKLGRHSHKKLDNNKMDLKEFGMGEEAWRGFIWLSARANGGFLSTR